MKAIIGGALVFGIVVSACRSDRVFSSALCNDSYTDMDTFDASGLTSAERTVMLGRVEEKLCVGHDGVFKKRPTETY